MPCHVVATVNLYYFYGVGYFGVLILKRMFEGGGVSGRRHLVVMAQLSQMIAFVTMGALVFVSLPGFAAGRDSVLEITFVLWLLQAHGTAELWVDSPLSSRRCLFRLSSRKLYCKLGFTASVSGRVPGC
jgi:hypothetical protein